eukprot:CAMPEP_0115417014 /NCGR_PEP_ID=MMETSP0271-20121206/23907_1 /TAXON_ID=71861 /ORGANISM="Scrippsiella trochoidea, Strain CCMP3099" /LENGTH=146 /DNA_ID=CAMNT_0002841391 /DNA_START=139 /DNA_END=576 /DNA_ORIENTATION=+
MKCSELVLAMRLDGHVRGGVRDAREAETLARLVVVQEGLVGLVDRALDDLPGAARARARAARVGQLDAVLLRLVQDVHVLRALEGLFTTGVCTVTLKWAATPGRAGTPLMIAGAAPPRRQCRCAAGGHEPALLVHRERVGRAAQLR